jgi:hypothetical protein
LFIDRGPSPLSPVSCLCTDTWAKWLQHSKQIVRPFCGRVQPPWSECSPAATALRQVCILRNLDDTTLLFKIVCELSKEIEFCEMGHLQLWCDSITNYPQLTRFTGIQEANLHHWERGTNLYDARHFLQRIINSHVVRNVPLRIINPHDVRNCPPRINVTRFQNRFPSGSKSTVCEIWLRTFIQIPQFQVQEKRIPTVEALMMSPLASATIPMSLQTCQQSSLI